MVELKTTLLNAADLTAKVDQASKLPYPEPDDKTKNKARWLQGIVLNCTQFKLAFRDHYFWSGKFEILPKNVDAWSVGHFTAVNRDYAPLHGATGATGYDLRMEPGVEINLSFGWCAPKVTSYKSAVVESIVTKHGYDKARENGNKIISKNEYTGVDSNDEAVAIKFEISCTGGQRPVYTITQAMV